MIALGVLASFYIVLCKSGIGTFNFKIDTEKLSSLFIWIILAAFVGGKLFFFLEDKAKYAENPSLLKDAKGGGLYFTGLLFLRYLPLYGGCAKRK